MTRRYFNSLTTPAGKLQRKATEDFVPTKVVNTKHGDIGFYCAGRVCLYRADTFHTKEPETLEWIDSFKGDVVMWDIGANVGVYSLYAALKENIRILAFEPSAFNYFILMKNIDINNLDGKISALCLAFNDISVLSCLNMNYLEVGDSCHQLVSYENRKKKKDVNLQQAVLSMSIDDFIRNYNPPFPTHIKIDVDGGEAAIIKGASRTLSDPRLRSILIEIDEQEPDDIKIIETLKRIGFELLSKKHAPQFEGSPLFNYVFWRK
jgi:FkbM family methyltransferase